MIYLGGVTQIWYGQGCAAPVSNLIPIFTVKILTEKGAHLYRFFPKYRSFFTKNFRNSTKTDPCLCTFFCRKMGSMFRDFLRKNNPLQYMPKFFSTAARTSLADCVHGAGLVHSQNAHQPISAVCICFCVYPCIAGFEHEVLKNCGMDCRVAYPSMP